MSFSEVILIFGAVAATPEAELAALFSSTGEDYLRARTALVEQKELLPVLKDRSAKSTWSETSWREDALVDVAISWMESPAIGAQIYALDGVNPAKYTQRRRPDPEVGRELRAIRGAAPFLLEIELKTFANYPLISSEAEARSKEALALRGGVLSALGGSDHPAAPHALKEAMLDDRNPLAIRRVAALGLGQTNARIAFRSLALIAEDPAAPVELRSGAIAGIGQLRSLASLEVLARLAQKSREPAELRTSAVAALGTLGNAWVLRRHPSPSGETIRERASRALVEVLGSEDGASIETQLIEAMVMIAHPSLKKELSALAQDAAKGDAKARAQRALSRLDMALRRAS